MEILQNKIKVLIVEDNLLNLKLASDLLLIDGFGVISCVDAESVAALLNANEVDLILMDINLPEMNGMELCKVVKQQYPAIHIVGLSTSGEVSIIQKMIDNGAAGYLLKDASKAEIIDALHKVVKGKEYVNFSVSQILKTYKTDTHQLPVLTRREKEILELISEGLTNQEIAQQLFVTVTTVDSHRKNMLTKFKVKNTAALVKIAIVNKLI